MAYQLGLQIKVKGEIAKPDCLVISNHISFLDIIVISSFHPARFLSKATLLYWPLIGFVASRSGTVFIKRGQNSGLKHLLEKVRCILKKQQSMIIFPEGTTSNGETPKKFYSCFLQAAIDTNKYVQPVTIQYIRDGKADRTAAYIANDNFIINLIKLMAKKSTHAEIIFSHPIKTNTMNRTELATTCHHIISNAC